MSNLFKAPIKEQSAQVIANHLPKGRAWNLKNDPDSEIRKLLRSLAASYNQVEQKIEELHDELDINKTFALLREWEVSVLLPDSCLGDIDDIEERRSLVKTRFQRKTIVTLQEFQTIVDTFFPDLNVNLFPGSEFFTFEYEFEMHFLSGVNEKFILVAEVPLTIGGFEYEFEFEFEGGPDVVKLRCFIEEFLPANAYLLIIFKG